MRIPLCLVSSPLLLLLLAEQGLSQRTCVTIPTQGGTSRPERCVFPFRHKGITYEFCTRDRDPDDELWCSVEVDINGNHVTGNGRWGHCDEDACFTNPRIFEDPPGSDIDNNDDDDDYFYDSSDYGSSNQEPTTNVNSRGQKCNTVSGRTPHKPCQFPFRYKGRLHRDCTTEDDAANQRWCSTKVNFDNDHLTGNWGHCDCRLRGNETCMDPEDDGGRSSFSLTSDSGTYLPGLNSGECAKKVGRGRAEEPPINAFPFAALIGLQRSRGTFNYFCGGSLINSRYVLTAAHCVGTETLDTSQVYVTLGEYDTREPCDCRQGKCAKTPQTFRVESVTVHESWDLGRRDQMNDIALLRLNGVVKMSESVAPICLPKDASRASRQLGVPNLQDGLTDLQMKVMGWGRILFDTLGDLENGGPTATPVVMATHIPGVSRRACEDAGRRVYRREISSRLQMCASSQGKRTCIGDSGAALAGVTERRETFVQLGITSYGSFLCGDGNPGVYTRLTGYMSWITANLRP